MEVRRALPATSATCEERSPLCITVEGLFGKGGALGDRVLTPAEGERILPHLSHETLKARLTGDRGIDLLMIAIAERDLPYATLLLQSGASPHRRSANGATAIDFACQNADISAQRLLLGRDPSWKEPDITVHLAKQTLVMMVEGRSTPVRIPVATGGDSTPTPTGIFVITEKARNYRSKSADLSMPYFMRLGNTGTGLHEGHVGAGPVSKGCIRLRSGDAGFVFRNAKLGDIVSISTTP